MLIVIGKNGCSACLMAKNLLTQKGLNFTYLLLEELNEEEKKKYITLARMQGKMSMPIIIKDEKCYSIQDIMKGDII